MSRIKKFNNFAINESAITEDKEWYVKEGYVTDPSIKTKEDLFARIEKDILPAWEKFIKENNIPAKGSKITIEEGRHTYINLTTALMTEDMLGPIFSNVLSKCGFVFFSGKEIAFTEQDGEFMFRPTIWTTLNISYESKRGGSNGMNYPIVGDDNRSNDIWYYILEGKFYNIEEARKKEKGK